MLYGDNAVPIISGPTATKGFVLSSVKSTHASVPAGGSAAVTFPLAVGSRSFLLRRLHSLTGILFGLYICVHLFVNATLIEGARHDGQPTVFQQQVDQIHRLPLLLAIEWMMIYIPLLYHTFYGIYIVVTGQPNVGNYRYAKNYAYLAQRISAMLLVLFIAFHVLTMKGVFGGPLTFDPVQATASTVRHFDTSFMVTWVVYPIGILAATFHLANGFWTAAITWGLTVSAAAQKRWGAVCAGLFIATTAAGFAALAGGAFSKMPMLPEVPHSVPAQPAPLPTIY